MIGSPTKPWSEGAERRIHLSRIPRVKHEVRRPSACADIDFSQLDGYRAGE